MLTLFEAVCAGWTKDPEAFIIASPHPATKHLVCDGFGAGQVDHDLAIIVVRRGAIAEAGLVEGRTRRPIQEGDGGRVHEGFAAHYDRLFAQHRAAMGRLTERLFAEIGREPPAPPIEIAGALMALTHGLVLQRRPRPQGSPDPAGHMIKLILKGLFEISRPGAGEPDAGGKARKDADRAGPSR